MAKRPDDARGALIFQEGKCIEDEYYIIAVYDDPATCTISFSAYELENDSTYTLPFTYSEFDERFQYDSELMNPANQDGRFRWVIDRLSFIVDYTGQKMLVLADDGVHVQEDEALVEEQPKAQAGIPSQSGGKIDAATRAKLIKELDTQDDAKLYNALVKSDAARKKFLSDLHAKRALEQLKASQRLQKADDEREARIAKLETIRKQQEAKAEAYKAATAAKQSTLAAIQALMKQKEAQAIRRLIQEKDEQDRGMGREKDAARQRRRLQERTANEVAAMEAQRAAQLGRKRDDQVEKRDAVVVKRNKQIAARVHHDRAAERLHKVKIKELKDAIIEELWRLKREKRVQAYSKRTEFKRLEEERAQKLRAREVKRAIKERDTILEMRQQAAKEEEEIQRRRDLAHREFLSAWKMEAAERALVKREAQRLAGRREHQINAQEEGRLRRFREAEFLESLRSGGLARAAAPAGQEEDEKGEEPEAAKRQSTLATGSAIQTTMSSFMGATAAEHERFQRTFNQVERQRRHAEREEKRRQEQMRRGKKEGISQDPKAAELARIMAWRADEEQLKQYIADARLSKELALEQSLMALTKGGKARQDLWEYLEKPRSARIATREQALQDKTIARAKALRPGSGLPAVFSY